VSAVKHVVIAAAGLGSRLGLGRPKCLLDFDGQPLIAHQLNLLKDIPDVRIVVGFEGQKVIDTARKIRSDILFVRNPAFRSTTTLHSYALGATGLTKNCVFMDADILFDPFGFQKFIDACQIDATDPLIAVTKAKTKDAVFAHVKNSQVTKFSRTDLSKFEWANLCYLPPRYCESGDGAVFERMNGDLPLRSICIESLEIDTPEDYENALLHGGFGSTDLTGVIAERKHITAGQI
jgi:GTP:adenosylcobinamide-phosphate guanylyltransferase